MDDVEDEMMEGRSLSTSDHIKSDKYEEKHISKEKMKMYPKRDLAFDSQKPGKWKRSGSESISGNAKNLPIKPKQKKTSI